MSIEGALERLRSEVHRSNDPQYPAHIQRFEFLELGGHFHLEFYGDPSGNAYAKVLSENLM